MTRDTYYQADLAWVHHAGYSHHIERAYAGILRLLRDGGLWAGARVLATLLDLWKLERALNDEQPRKRCLAKEPVPGGNARLAMLVEHFVCILEGERVREI